VYVTLSINDTKHNNTLRYAEFRILYIVMLSVIMLNVIMMSVFTLNAECDAAFVDALKAKLT
jgi:hypothetical protein